MRSESGEFLFSQGRVEEAERLFLKEVVDDPFNVESLNNLGVVACNRGDLEASLRYFVRCLEIDPFFKDSLLNCGDLLRSLGRLHELAPFVSAALERRINDTELSELWDEIQGNRSFVQDAKPKNINTREYWDIVYRKEIGRDEWRRNLVGFSKIKTYIGIHSKPGDTILDIGCGYGALLEDLKSLGHALTGWDISEIAIQRILGLGYQGRVVDFTEHPPEPEQKYDFVIASEFLEHVEDPLRMVEKMVGMARRSLILAVPDNCLDHDQCEEHLQCFNEQALESQLRTLNGSRLYIEAYVEEYVYLKNDGKTLFVKRPSLLAILEK